MAAHLLRAELVLADPLVIWNDQWFGGHHTPSYSALFPRVAAPTGVRIGGAASVLAAVVLFEHLAHRRLGPCGTLGALWFGAAAPGMLVMGQLPFALGVALGLSALLALDRRPWAAAALGVATALASPLAAAFLALCSITLHGRSSSAALTAPSASPCLPWQRPPCSYSRSPKAARSRSLRARRS